MSNEFNVRNGLKVDDFVLSYAINADVDTGTEVIDTFPKTIGASADWDYVIVKGANVKAGHIRAAWDAASNTIDDSGEVNTVLLGTVVLTFTIDIDADMVRLRATVVSDDWHVRALRKVL